MKDGTPALRKLRVCGEKERVQMFIRRVIYRHFFFFLYLRLTRHSKATVGLYFGKIEKGPVTQSRISSILASRMLKGPLPPQEQILKHMECVCSSMQPLGSLSKEDRCL